MLIFRGKKLLRSMSHRTFFPEREVCHPGSIAQLRLQIDLISDFKYEERE